MSPNIVPRNHRRSAQLKHPRRHLLASACCLALLSMGAAHAEEQAKAAEASKPGTAAPAAEPASRDKAAELEGVTVTGIRQAIASAVETKQESNSIVEAISAEDIGKLPDVSIADSISRLPGLATQRVDGRSQVINIRGMSEQFVGTLLNGREQVSTGDSRGVEFDQYPAELINAVTVYKTPDAGLIGQGLSGTVNLQTIRPLDLPEQRIVLGASGEVNSLGDVLDGGSDKGYRASVSYVDQLAEDTVGVALGIARLKSPFQEEHYKAWWWARTDAWGAPQTGKPEDAVALQGSEGWVKSRDLVRDGLMGALEFKPNDNFHSMVDVYYSKFSQDEAMNGTMWTNDPWWRGQAQQQISYTNVGTTTVGGVPVVSSGTLNGVQPVVRNDSNLRDDRLFSAGWANSYTVDAWTFKGDLSYSSAKREQSTLETYAGLRTGQSIDFDLQTSSGFGRYSLPNLSDPNTVYLWDPQGWGHDGRLEDSDQEDIIKAARLEASREFDSSSAVSSLDFGVNLNRRSKEKSAQVYFADLPNGRAPVLVDPSLLRSPTSLGFFGGADLLNFDPRALLSRYYTLTLNQSNDDLRKDFIVEEDVDTYFVQANLDFPVGDTLQVRGNVGVQHIRTDQSSTGFNVGNSSVVGAQTLGTSYDDTLPSMNLVGDFGNGWMLRLGGAKTLMRPPINYLSADSQASVSTTTRTWSGGGGNPLLEPYRATAGDLSLEKYIDARTYFGVALFYKDLESYIYRSNQEWDFTGYANNGIEPISNIGNFSTWENGQGGYMRGVELSGALDAALLSPSLEGFGALVNVSYTESSIDPDPSDNSAGSDTIPGLSKVVGNATVYYEANGFSVRLSQRHRGAYRGEYGSLFGTRQYRFTKAERQLDLQLGYDLGESIGVEGLSLIFQIYNLNNSPFRTEVSEATGTGIFLPEEHTEYGRQYLLGVRYDL